jgi:hypothetical protein
MFVDDAIYIGDEDKGEKVRKRRDGKSEGISTP